MESLGNGLNIQRDDAFTYLTTSMGLRLKWDDGANIFVTVEKELVGRAVGLCGVFDFNPKSTQQPENLIAVNGFETTSPPTTRPRRKRTTTSSS